MYLGDLMEKAESGQFSILSFLLQESQTTVKAVMEETGFSKATLTKYVTLLNDKALDSGLELTIHLEDENPMTQYSTIQQSLTGTLNVNLSIE